MAPRGISVIMPSYLGDYQGSRSNPVYKFIRAVKSFIDQDYPKELCELIIISDACKLTIETYNENFKDIDNIRLIKKELRSNGYPGEARQMGIDASSFDIITYLDSDDMITIDRLNRVNRSILDSVYVLDSVMCQAISETKWTEKNGKERHGTWQISHKSSISNELKWKDKIKRGEDVDFIHSIIRKFSLNKKINYAKVGGYIICHGIGPDHNVNRDI